MAAYCTPIARFYAVVLSVCGGVVLLVVSCVSVVQGVSVCICVSSDPAPTVCTDSHNSVGAEPCCSVDVLTCAPIPMTGN